MPLLTGMSITNTNKTFPVALSYCPGETARSYNFFFNTLRAEIFVGGVIEPGVIIGNQAVGLIASIQTYDSMPNSQLQFCQWHAAEAMRARWTKNGYRSEEIRGNSANLGLIDLTWRYLQSETKQDLDYNRAALLAKLKEPEKRYIKLN